MWNTFDTILVLSSVVEILMEILGAGAQTSGGFATMRLIRIVRITRLVRLLRLARVVRFVRALTVLVHSILATLKALVWAMLLLTINIYFFAILFTQTVASHLHAPQTACSAEQERGSSAAHALVDGSCALRWTFVTARLGALTRGSAGAMRCTCVCVCKPSDAVQRGGGRVDTGHER